jgi:hypothetical protein
MLSLRVQQNEAAPSRGQPITESGGHRHAQRRITARALDLAIVQQAVRFALFQVVQAAARAEQRAIPAKGLTGRGYDGHTFWDMET